MRSIKREHRLYLETLEDRWVPATIRLIGGNLTVTAGNGNNILDLTGFAISGDASFLLGNGDNTITLDATSLVVGTLEVRTGNGNNTLTLEVAQTYLANILFGSGDDTLELNNAALVLTGYVDGGTGSNTLTQTDGTLGEPLWLAGL